MKRVVLLLAVFFLLVGAKAVFAHPPLAQVRIYENGVAYERTVILHSRHHLPHHHKFLRWVRAPHVHPNHHPSHDRYDTKQDRYSN
jgi:hypothetical protein